MTLFMHHKITKSHFFMAAVIACFGLVSSYTAIAQEIDNGQPAITEQSVIADGEGQILKQSAIISAPVADVWTAFTTEEGYTSWAVPNAKMDFRIGGVIESSYAADFTVGDPENIKNQIVAYVPERILVLRNIQAPSGFASRETLDKLVSIFEFEPVTETTTQITVYGVGYGTDAESEKMIAFFKPGNDWTFRQLEKMFVSPEK